MSRSRKSLFWDFSLDLYGRPGVTEACLALQARRDLDVNMLLFCCWCGARGEALTAGELGERIVAVRPWQDQVVKPLRAARRWLKGQQTAPATAAEALRQAIKAQELEAERLEQLILADAATNATDRGAPALAAANLKAYFAALGLVPGEVDWGDLAALLCGLFRELSRDEALSLLA